MYWPYVKPFAVIPLNFGSNHPEHIKRALPRNELNRLMKRTNVDECRLEWAKYWRFKFMLAGYPEKLLDEILADYARGWKYVKTEERLNYVNHVEKWRGAKTPTARSLWSLLGKPVRTAWRMGKKISSLALSSNKRNDVQGNVATTDNLRNNLYHLLKRK